MANKEFLSVKEFAELTGKTQQGIYKQLNNRLNRYVKLVDSQKMIDYRALQEVYGIEVEQPIQPELNNQFNQNQQLYEILKQELEAKNRQIEELQTELAKEREYSREQANQMAVIADQAQKLQLAQMQTQMLESVPIGEADVEVPTRRWWKFWG